ncbi:AMP-binding protein [Nocardia farcinica]|uniref:AMP-binding protein n=1 Tax=Nocardia farcinica TaxID=37329 RepID=UPI0024584FF6|nr:AMP-binding protein [Nocardia farcinica]
MRTIPDELARQYHEQGWWIPETIGELLTRELAAAPGAEFHVHSAIRPWHGTCREVEHLARRLAEGLRGRGVGPGDVVAFQLPNWTEAAMVFWASAFLGATVVPIVHFYGRKEVGYILRAVRPHVFVGTTLLGDNGVDEQLLADVPVAAMVGEDFETLLGPEPMPGTLTADPASAALIAFTSGTTSDPKGVVHSHLTLGHETRQLAGMYPRDRGHQLTAAPVGHFIGMVNAFLIPVLDRLPVNLTDVWDPGRVLTLMTERELTVGGGVAYYMTSLLDHPGYTPAHLPYLRYAGLGGASVPAAVTTRLAGLGITVYRSYGSTEHPSITGSHPSAPADKRLFTDGAPLPGVEIRLADDGEILSRGPDLCAGYTDPALTARAFDTDGWYHTGDIGTLDADGFLTITDRKADLIIRGGENISALEVEEILLDLPGVTEAVAVAVPDERLGERTAAVLRLQPGASAPDMSALRAHFATAGVAKQKWPEQLHVVEDFPRTASGKVKKFAVRRSLVTSGPALDPEDIAARPE